MKVEGIAFELTTLVPLMLIAGSIGLVTGARAGTMVTANGFASIGPVDEFGNVNVEGYHSAVLNLVSVEDANKTWTLNGELFKCTIIPIRLSTGCSRSGNTNSNLFLSCDTGAGAPCASLSSGVRSSTSAALVNTPGVSDHYTSSCAMPACPGEGGCPDPPSEHGPGPKVEISKAAVETGERPLILAIKGRGAFAERNLALLYDDGFAVASKHRLAFVTMPHQVAKEPVLVYSTHELPMVFEAQYGDVEVTLAGDRLEEEHLQTFFAMEGAYAVVDFGKGRQIGLANQVHNEDWYIDLKQYTSRYRHRGGVTGLSSGPSEPVTLTLATVFIWDGETWVADPIEVLEELSDSFEASAAELARLRSAVR